MRRLAATTLMLVVFSALATSAQANHNLTELTPAGDNTTKMSADGSHVAFSTRTPLSPGDNDNLFDTYDWHDGLTEQASVDENGQNHTTGQYGLAGISNDGRHIFMDLTLDPLTSEDTDTVFDVYERFAGTTRLVSQGPLNPSAQSASFYVLSSEDGTRVFFSTRTQLTPDDANGCTDTFERHAGTTTRISAIADRPGDCPIFQLHYFSETPAGPRYIISTNTPLVAADTDTNVDIYESLNGTLRLLTDGPSASDPNGYVDFRGVSDRGDEVYFSTSESLTPDDTDSCPPSDPLPGCPDIYEASNGSISLVSTGPADADGPIQHNLGTAAKFGGLFFFTTSAMLTTDDTDGGQLDLYQYSHGVTTLLTPGPNPNVNSGGSYNGSSPDGSRVFFSTDEKLVPEDTNIYQDVYERQNGVTTMLSPGSPFGSYFQGISESGDRVFFITDASHVPSDTNGVRDLYERYNGNYFLIRTRPPGVTTGDIGGVSQVSTDGTRILFRTAQRLSTADTDNEIDYYRISVAPSAYARPKAATPINVAFVPAYAACGSPNRVHAAPLAFNSCAPPAQTSTYLTLGTPDANGAAAKSVASLRLLVLPGNPSTPANEADARYEVSITDVRNKSDLTDYTGALKLDAPLQITDRNNPDVDGGSPNATGSQPSFPVVVPCAATGDNTVGSTCSITTTANTLAPGALVEGMRAIWETGQVRVFDGGADGNPATADGDGLFLVQGVFIP